MTRTNVNRELPSILAIVSFFPIPADQGDPLRVLMMLKSLHAHSRLKVIATRRSTTTREDEAALRRALPGAEICVTELDGDPSLFRSRLLRAAKGVARGVPPWVYSHASSSALEQIRMLSPGCDTTILIGEAAALYLSRVGSKRVIWDKANVLSASLNANRRALRSIKERTKALATEWPAKRFERRSLDAVDIIWVTSDEDARRFEDSFSRIPDAVIPSCIEIEDWGKARIDGSAREFFWMSSFRYPPNWDGLVRLLDALEVVDTSAAVRLRVAGFGATERQVAVLKANPRVRYLGFADSPPRAADGVAAAVVPIWAGAGVKLKTLAMAAMGIPLIGTPAALEGIPNELAVALEEDPLKLAMRLTQWHLSEAELNSYLAQADALLTAQFSARAFERRVSLAIAKAVQS